MLISPNDSVSVQDDFVIIEAWHKNDTWTKFMKKNFARLVLATFVLSLGACVVPALMPSQSALMWAILKPLVGFDPNQVNLFEQPLVKQRMTALLGDRYHTAMQLLRTANQLQQEGPLFFLVSRFTPIPEIAEGAGLVWNSDTNQMAALLRKGEVAQVFVDSAQAAVVTAANHEIQKVVPAWPTVLQPWLKLEQQAPGNSVIQTNQVE
jgi:hypothetical protein